jgi:hypothetical protein
MKRTPFLAVSLAALVLTSASANAETDRETWRPPALEPTGSCDVYAGTSNGNDPTNIVELLVCTNGAAVTGKAQYSGKLSGWNRRAFSGAWSEDGRALELHESAIIEQKPNAGWRFCTIDRYVLVKQADPKMLVGTYDSAACQDHARLSLTRTGSAVPAAHDEPEPPRPAVPPAPSPAPAARRSCSCRHAGAAESGATGAVRATIALCACVLRARGQARRARSGPRA